MRNLDTLSVSVMSVVLGRGWSSVTHVVGIDIDGATINLSENSTLKFVELELTINHN